MGVNIMESEWKNLSSDQKRDKLFQSWLSPKGISFCSPEAEITYKAKVTRLFKVVKQEVPDRVPVIPSIGFFPAYYSGMQPYDVMYDYGALSRAWKKYALDFAPDGYGGVGTVGSGRLFEIMDYKLYRWPGHGTTIDSPYQCVEAEYMKADEYDLLIQDPSDFWIRTYLPRIFGKLEPLKLLSALSTVQELPMVGAYMVPFGNPDVQATLKALLEAGREAEKWATAHRAINKEVTEAGFPIMSGGSAKAPFDTIGDTLRGTQRIMIDMYRQPGKLIEAMEKLTPLMINMGVNAARTSGIPFVFIPLHKGADGFMSLDQFKTFYWPTLKKVILGLIDEGVVPWLFAEGSYNSRLDIIKDLPKGKVIWKFDTTDMVRAKNILGDCACIEGNVPVSLLMTAAPKDVTDYCKKLIDSASKGGGFILSSGSVLDKVKTENLHAMIDYTKEYGIYR
jgi:uroporphyrinogen-III decarboxylase